MLGSFIFRVDFEKVLDKTKIERLFDLVVGKNNKACNGDAKNGGLIEASKHVDLKFQVATDHIIKGDMRLIYVPATKIKADIMAKNLQLQMF